MKNNEHIFIIGAGAIGKVLATFLQLEGKNVTLLRGSKPDQAAYTEKVTIELKDGTVVNALLNISGINNYDSLDGMVVLTTKSYANMSIAKALQPKMGNSSLVILQNGLNVELPFIQHGFTRIYRCVLFATSQVLSPAYIRFKPVKPSPIGIIKGNKGTLLSVVRQMHTDFFEFRSEENIQPIIWSKAIINSVFNSVCTLLETDNGIFHRNNKAQAVAKQLTAGCIAVARANGVVLDEEKIGEDLLMISRFSDGQMISTLQDIRQKRKTEIDSLNFAICDLAEELHMSDLVPGTRLLGELIALKSELSMAGSTQGEAL